MARRNSVATFGSDASKEFAASHRSQCIWLERHANFELQLWIVSSGLHWHRILHVQCIPYADSCGTSSMLCTSQAHSCSSLNRLGDSEEVTKGSSPRRSHPRQDLQSVISSALNFCCFVCEEVLRLVSCIITSGPGFRGVAKARAWNVLTSF